MAQSNGRKRFLNIVILVCLIGIAVGMAPTLQQRFAELIGEEAPPPAKAAWERVPAALPASPVTDLQPAGLGRLEAEGAAAGDDAGLPDRRVEQAQVIRDELAQRERRIAAQEEIMRRQVLAKFWQRQAAASAATVALAVLIVILISRRVADWTGFAKRLREEETRMRNLQLSVIGALEEFESEVAAARAWAAAEARSRRPVAGGEEAQPQTEAAGFPALAELDEPFFKPRVFAEPPPVAAGPGETRTQGGRLELIEPPAAVSRQGRLADPSWAQRTESGGQEQVWEATRQAAESAREGIAGPATPKSENSPDPTAVSGFGADKPRYPSENIMGPPRPMRIEAEEPVSAAPFPAQRQQEEAPKSGRMPSVWEEACRAAQMASEAGQALPADRLPAETPESVPAASEPEAWVRRFLESDDEDAQIRADARPAEGSERPGPWGGPARREGPMPQPALPRASAATGPGLREQVEYLAAEGFPEREIARRLNLSREEVQMVLTLGRRSRMAGVVRAEESPLVPSTPARDWSRRDAGSHEMGRP